MGYQLGIDIGTTYTAVAISRDGRTEIFSLGGRSASIPSLVFLGEEGSFVIGEGAARRASSDPARVARAFKRRMGDQTPILLGGVPISPESLTAKLLRWTVERVSEQEGTKPESLGISHPANWGPFKIDMLHQAIEIAGLDLPTTTLSEPEAAAIHYASTERVEVGDTVAVYDLGGGTFDACVLRKTDLGFETLGRPEGIERLGGIDFDEAIFSHVLSSVEGGLEVPDPAPPGLVAAASNLRRECVDAKEALSEDTEVVIPVVFPELQSSISLTREQFEGMIQTPLAETTKALRRTLQSAGVQPSAVKRVLLVGGSSRIPLVGEMVSAELGRPVGVDLHPKHSVAFGAGIAAGAALKAASVVQEVPETEAGSSAGPAAATAAAAATVGAPPPASADATVVSSASQADQIQAASPAADVTRGAAPAADEPSGLGVAATGGAETPPPPSRPPGPSSAGDGRRRALMVGGPIAAVVAVILAVVLLSGGGDDDERSPETEAVATTTEDAPGRPGGAVSAGEWRTLRAAPTLRQQVAATSVKGQIYVVGGLTRRGGTSVVEVYDPFINTWRSGPSLPNPIHHAMAVTFQGNPVIIGGWIPEGQNLTAEVSDRVYTLRDGTWEELPPLPEPKVAAAGATARGEIIVTGGQGADGELSDASFAFDGESWSERAPLPTPREHVAATSDRRFVYVVGGRELSSDANSDAFERYDPVTDTWEQLTPMLTPRGSIGGVAHVGNEIVVVGGEDPNQVLPGAEAYDIEQETWSELPDLITPRHGVGMVGVGRAAYVIVGADQIGHAGSTSVVEALDFSIDS